MAEAETMEMKTPLDADALYAEALDKYEEALKDYDRRMAEWEAEKAEIEKRREERLPLELAALRHDIEWAAATAPEAEKARIKKQIMSLKRSRANLETGLAIDAPDEKTAKKRLKGIEKIDAQIDEEKARIAAADESYAAAVADIEERLSAETEGLIEKIKKLYPMPQKPLLPERPQRPGN